MLIFQDKKDQVNGQKGTFAMRHGPERLASGSRRDRG